MKRIIKNYSLLLGILILTVGLAYADNGEKRKTFTKTYSLSKNQKVIISNKFGEVKVNSWNRNEVRVDVTIIVAARNEAATQRLLDNINIKTKEGISVTFTTEIANTNGNTNNAKMEINYIVYMPDDNPLDIKNEFGNTILPDWKGALSVKESFGSLTTGALTNVKDIKVEFGSLTSTAIHNGSIKISYSKLKINTVSGAISGKVDFCKGSTLGLSEALKNLDIKASYSDVIFNIPPNLNANFDIELSFGDLKNKSTVTITDNSSKSEYGPNFDKEFSGKIGSGNTPVIIKSSFGDITLK
ncbi:MAG: hypothetical protein ACK5NK_12145 [Niabella sp.]